MSNFNFGQIGDIISNIMDSDYIDIKRDAGTTLEEIYSNIPCHIAYKSNDNPDPTSVEIKPIIQSITVHLPNWVDIKNNDFLIAKKMDGEKNLLMTYSGRCGNPVVSQGRKKVSMIMSGTESEDPTPPPPKNPIKIYIDYMSDDKTIKDTTIQEVEEESSFSVSAPTIDGYSFFESYVDDVKQDSSVVYISNVKNINHHIIFAYIASVGAVAAKFLVNGLYTKNNGSLASGYHLYKKIKIDEISKNENNNYEITCDNVKLVHEDNGKQLQIKIGTKLVLIPEKKFIEVSNIISTDSVSNKIKFEAKEFIPTEAEKNAYDTGWYG